MIHTLPTILLLSTGSWIVLIFLGILLVLIVRQMMSSKKQTPADTPVPDLANLSIREARRGDIITLRDASKDFDDLSFTVEKIHRYEWGRHHWYELTGPSPEGNLSLEWEEDDGLHISLTHPGKGYRLSDLGLQEDDLIRMDEEQAAANTIELDGSTYHYESSHETGFFDNEAGSGEGFYLWNFEAADGKTTLAIEKWEGEAFEATVSQTIEPDRITVFRK